MAMKMKRSEISIQSVNKGDMYVFADMLAYSKDWPSTIEHNGKIWEYASNATMPEEAAGTYSGRAHYKMQGGWQAPAPLTHKEFGAYLNAVGKAMVERNVNFNEAREPATQADKSRLLDSVRASGVLAERLKYVENMSWAMCRALNADTVDGDNPNYGNDDDDDDEDEEAAWS